MGNVVSRREFLKFTGGVAAAAAPPHSRDRRGCYRRQTPDA